MVIRCRESSDYLHLSRGVCHGSGLRGWTGELRKLWDEDILYNTRFEGEATVGDVRVVEEEGGG